MTPDESAIRLPDPPPNARIGPVRASALAPVGILAALVLALVVALLLTESAVGRWAVVLAVAATGPLLMELGSRGGGSVLLGAPGLFTIIYLLGYLAPLSAFLGERDAASVFLGYAYRDRDAALQAALAYASVGALAFWLGWWSVRRAPTPQHAPEVRWHPDRLQLVVIVFSLVGLVAFALGVVAIGGPRALLDAQSDRLRAFAGINFLLYGAQLLPLGWLLVLLSRFRRPGPVLTPLMVIAGIAALAPTLLLGTKVLLFVTAGTALLMLHQVRMRFGPVAIVLFGAGGLVAATGYDLFFREYLVNREITSVVLGQLSAKERVELVLERSIGSQFMQLQNLAVIIDAHDQELTPERGRTFLPVFTQLIPRKLWAGKPTTPAGLFAGKLRPDLVERGTTFPPSFVGELYWNGGLLALTVGMLLFGWTARRVERWRALGTPAGLLVGSLTVMMVPMLLRGNFSDTVTAWLTFAVPSWVGLRFATSAVRETVHEGRADLARAQALL